MYSCLFQELFVEHLAKEAYERTAQGKRKTIQKKDIGMLKQGWEKGLIGWVQFHPPISRKNRSILAKTNLSFRHVDRALDQNANAAIQKFQNTLV